MNREATSFATRLHGLYEGIARQLRLEELLRDAASLFEHCCPGSRAVIHVLRDDRFHGYTAHGKPQGFLASLDLTSPGLADHPAPWWGHSDRLVVLDRTLSWGPWIGAARAEGWTSAWSRVLRTPAGEIAGSVLLLFRTASPGLGSAKERLAEAAGLATAIIEQANLLSELRWHAGHDAVTGLHNRAWFERYLDRILTAHGGLSALCLFSLDLSRINRVLGYRVGELVLREAASRIGRTLGIGSAAARIGDQELACAVAALSNRDEAVRSAENARNALSAPFEIDAHTLTVSASAAVCYPGEHGSDAASLLTRARVALAPPTAGVSAVTVFSPEMDEGGADRFEIEQRLRMAIGRDEFLLHFQPQIRLADGGLAGVEALVRWRQTDLGLVSPAVFIPVAEETGLIGAIGDWVLRAAGRQAASWLRTFQPVRVGVNVSAVQFSSPAFVASVISCLARTGLPPELLELEITESLVLRDLNATVRDLHRLRERGILLSLDDFGTGQCSLAYLRDLPVDRVKIDRSFLRHAPGGPPRQILEHIVGMVRDLGLVAIAEGVETVEQLHVVRELGCEEVQGFLFGKPMPARDLPEWRANSLLHRDM